MSETSAVQTLEELIRQIHQDLKNATTSRRSSFHTMGLATIMQNTPDVRTVILRDYLENSGTMIIHTDIRSPKITALTSNPEACLANYCHQQKIQLRCRGHAEIHHQNDITAQRWKDIPASARRCYLSHMPPSTLVDHPITGYDAILEDPNVDLKHTEYGFQNFAVIFIHLEEIDWLKLAATGHRRALFRLKNQNWQGHWVIP